MDLRERKTLRSIREAFLALLAEKPLEKITVKELTARAEISKATFYLHYHSVFDLSDALQRELVDDVVGSLVASPGALDDPARITTEIFGAFEERRDLVSLLFSRNGQSALAARIEEAIREAMLAENPALRDDARFNTLLTFEVQGGYWAYAQNHRRFSDDAVVEAVADASDAVTRLMGGPFGDGARG